MLKDEAVKVLKRLTDINKEERLWYEVKEENKPDLRWIEVKSYIKID